MYPLFADSDDSSSSDDEGREELDSRTGSSSSESNSDGEGGEEAQGKPTGAKSPGVHAGDAVFFNWQINADWMSVA